MSAIGMSCSSQSRPKPADRWLLPGIYLALAVGTTLVFSGVIGNGFISYDDKEMIYGNPRVNQGLTRDGLKFALTGPHVGLWHPLTTLSILIDCHLFGAEPASARWHHGVSLLLHIGSVLLLFTVLREMTDDLWPSALVAALFAIHPLRVESVAWAAERKDVLSGFFGMLTLWAYVRYARRPGVPRYCIVLLVYCLGLLSKPTLVTLPCALLLLDYWPLGRLGAGGWRLEEGGARNAAWRKLILEKLPLLAAAAVVAGVTIRVSADTDSIQQLASLSLPWRLSMSAVAYVAYLRMTIYPVGLAILYPHPGLAPAADLGAWVAPALGAALLMVVLTAGAIYCARTRPYLLVGWLWYLGTLVPVIGLIQVGHHAYADRYSYLPSIGIYIAIAWAMRDAIRQWPRAAWPLTILSAGCLLALMAACWNQVGYWRNDLTLYEHTLAVTTDNRVIHNNLGNTLLDLGRPREAISHYVEAVRINPESAQVHNNWGNALNNLGRPQEAIPHYEAALRIKPDFAEAHNNWGIALQSLGRPQDAIPHYQEALRINPDSAEAHSNWGSALDDLGRPDEALPHFEKALGIDPNWAVAHNNWGNALNHLNRPQEAIAHYQEALRLKPDFAKAHDNWGVVLAAQGHFPEAIAHFQEALHLDSGYEPARVNLRRAQEELQHQKAGSGNR